MFFSQLTQRGQTIAAIDGDTTLSYAQLNDKCQQFSEKIASILPSFRPLIFLKTQNNIGTLVAYVTALQCQYPMMLIDSDINQIELDRLIELYRPNLLIDDLAITEINKESIALADELALLLSTSGSTGSAKQVCLSTTNLEANARSICRYLPIEFSDKTVTTLPFFYSYGLSVINSHLLAGACIVFNQNSLVSREFWQLFKQHEISSFAGVPHSYDMLLKLRFERMDLPSLRYFTQAGGKLSSDKVQNLASYAQDNDKQFFVMYGQTEATARMAFMPTEIAIIKPDSIGKAIPNGVLTLQDESGGVISEPNKSGELVYSGSNIMLGYAESIADLAQFEPKPTLATGDIAYCDEEGEYFICGRIKRFIKLFGQRINLDEVETILAQKKLETYCCGDDTRLLVAIKKHNNIKELNALIRNRLKLHHSVIQVIEVNELPLTANGKKDYQLVVKLADESNV